MHSFTDDELWELYDTDPKAHALAKLVQRKSWVTMGRVWVAIADYGLNGADVLAVYASPPPHSEAARLADQKFVDSPLCPRDMTGFSGVTIEPYQVR